MTENLLIPRSEIGFGSWGGGAQSGTRVPQSTWRVLGHELCGHAWLMQRGVHPTSPGPVISGGRVMSRPSHDPTIAIENQIAKDVLGPTAPQRGMHTDPHAGESFGQITISGYPNNSSDLSALPATMQSRVNTAESFMKATAHLKADIVGHSDSVGSNGAKQTIANARAERVKAELVRRGIAASRFNQVIGVGSNECTTASPTPDPNCRKAEIFMYVYEKSSLRFP